eukprot:1613944-Rhodomonas_salina.3
MKSRRHCHSTSSDSALPTCGSALARRYQNCSGCGRLGVACTCVLTAAPISAGADAGHARLPPPSLPASTPPAAHVPPANPSAATDEVGRGGRDGREGERRGRGGQLENGGQGAQGVVIGER